MIKMLLIMIVIVVMLIIIVIVIMMIIKFNILLTTYMKFIFLYLLNIKNPCNGNLDAKEGKI